MAHNSCAATRRRSVVAKTRKVQNMSGTLRKIHNEAVEGVNVQEQAQNLRPTDREDRKKNKKTKR